MSSLPLSDWLDATCGVMLEVAASALAFESSEELARKNSLPRELPGAYVPLLTERASLQVGIASTHEGCAALARALLCMEPGEEVSHGDVADALGEIANIVAGALKGRMAPRAGSVTLGLPIFFNGAIEPTDKLEFAVADMRLGTIDASLVVVQHRQSTGN